MTSAILDKDAIKKAAPILQVLKKLAPQLCFAKATVVRAMEILAEEHNDKLRLEDAQKEDWVKVMDLRLRCLCYVVRAGEARKHKPDWVRELPWMLGEGDKDTEVALPGEERNKEYMYGWDSSVRLAWRSKGGNGDKEYSLPIRIQDDAKETDMLTASWNDGRPWHVSCMTVGTYKQGARKPSSSEAPLWIGTHNATKHKLVVVQRPDRNLLLSLQEQGKQRQQVRVDLFGPLPAPQPAVVDKSNPTIKAAAAFFVPLCEKYAEGELTLLDFKQARLQKAVELRKGKNKWEKGKTAAATEEGEGEEEKRHKEKGKKAAATEEGEGEEEKRQKKKGKKAAATEEGEEEKESDTEPTTLKRPAAAPVEQVGLTIN